MANNNVQHYSRLWNDTLAEITSEPGNWMRFLETAGGVYKYPAKDRLMIHAQYPDARACASQDIWNKKFGRIVKPGARGIALIDENGDASRLKYVFDVSDTEQYSENARPVYIWELRDEHKESVIGALNATYAVEGADASLENAINRVAVRLAGDYYTDNAEEIAGILEESGADEEAAMRITVDFARLLSVSAAYAVMSRCGLVSGGISDDIYFESVARYADSRLSNMLTVSVCDLSERILRDVEIAVNNYERERKVENERTDLHTERGLSDAGFDGEGTAGRVSPNRTLRANAEGISAGTPGNGVQPSADVGGIVPAPAGDGRGGGAPHGQDSARLDGEESAAVQSGGSDGLDSAHERASGAGGGNGESRTDLHLNDPPAPPPGLRKPETNEISELPATSSITLDEVDCILRDGGNSAGSALRIAARFAKDIGPEERAAYLRREYLRGRYERYETATGKGFVFGNHRIAAWFDESGIRLGGGDDSALYEGGDKVLITWDRAAARVNELMLSGIYAPRAAFDAAFDNEISESAERLLDFYRYNMRSVPEEWDVKGGYSAIKAEIQQRLNAVDECRKIIENLKRGAEFWKDDPDELLADLNATLLPPVIFPDDAFAPENAFTYFITEDEKDAYMLRGGVYNDGKFRILSCFLNDHDGKERISFLKDEYGTGGGTWSEGNGNADFSPSGGITLKRGSNMQPEAETTLKWPAVAKRIERLIFEGRYMTRAELDAVPGYERLMLARRVNGFYNNLSEEYERPFGNELNFNYPHDAEWEAISGLLDDAERVDGVLAQMRRIFENTSTEDRYYNIRKAGFEALSAHKDGTYTLFPGIERLPGSETVAARTTETPSEPRREQVEDLRESPDGFPSGAPQRNRQISMFDFDFNPLPVLPGVAEQREKIDQEAKRETENAEALADAQFLNIGEADKDRIAAQFASAPRSRETVNLVREIYGDTFGMTIREAMKRIAELVTDGKFETLKTEPEYLTEDEADEPESAHPYEFAEAEAMFDDGGESAVKQQGDTVTVGDIITGDIAGDGNMNNWRILHYYKEDPRYGDNYNVILDNGKGLIATYNYDKLQQAGYTVDFSVMPLSAQERNDILAEYEKRFGVCAWKRLHNNALFRGVLSITEYIGITDRITEYTDAKRRSEWFISGNEIIRTQFELPELILPRGAVTEDIYRTALDNGFAKPEVAERLKLRDEKVLTAAAYAEYLYESGRTPYKPVFLPSVSALIERTPNYRDYALGEIALEQMNKARSGKQELQTLLFKDGNVNRNGKRTRVTFEKDLGEKYRLYSDGGHPLYSGSSTDEKYWYVDTPSEYLVQIDNAVMKALPSEQLKWFDAYYERAALNFEAQLSDREKWADYSAAAILNRIEDAEKHNGPVRELREQETKQRKEAAATAAKAEAEAEKAAFEKDIADFEAMFISGTSVKEYKGGDKTALYAVLSNSFRHNGIDVPLRTKGWLSQKLVSINIHDGKFDSLTWNKTYSGAQPSTDAWQALSNLSNALYAKNSEKAQQSLSEPAPYVTAAESAHLFGEDTAEASSEQDKPVRYEVVLTSDAFPDPEDAYAIWNNETDDYYYDADDRLVAFPEQRQAEEFLQTLIGDGAENAEQTVVFDQQPTYKNTFRITDDRLGEGGAKMKFRNNINALQTLKAIELEGRDAMPAEQEILSRYIGWGGLPQAFDPDTKQWEDEYAELKALLTDKEYESARASTLNAHYTSPVVIKAMWEAVRRLGFERGNILEPSMGVGNFFGLIPESMNGSKLYGVELDDVTARIAMQLYPNADIQATGFEKTEFSDNSFDLAIGNVPFGDYGVADRRYDKYNFSIHNYFLAKALDKVRPGGITVLITSMYTMDAKNPATRKYLAKRAELLGAVRLPNSTFLKNAGTETTMDILFLQKRERPIEIEPEWVHLAKSDRYRVRVVELQGGARYVGGREYEIYDTRTGERREIPFEESEGHGTSGRYAGTVWNEDTANRYAGKLNDADDSFIPVNAYFAEHPEMVCGVMGLDVRMNNKYGRDDYTACLPIEGADLGDLLRDAIECIDGEYGVTEPSDIDIETGREIPADPNVKNFSYAVVDDTVYFRENSLMYPVDLPQTTLERIKGMIGLRDCVRELIDLQLDDYATDGEISEKQDELNNLYDRFTAEYGLLNDKGNRIFKNDSSYYLLLSLEIRGEDGEPVRKADMFTKRTIKRKTVITRVDTATEALAVSLGERARVDLDYMSELTGFDRKKLLDDLMGVVFLNVGSAESQDKAYVTADEYLSGNVRRKLELAEAAALTLPSLQVNVDALKAVQPKDLEAGDISVRLGTTWIDPKYVEQFMYELLKTSNHEKRFYQIKYHALTGEWQVTGKGMLQKDIATAVTYGTSRKNAYQIIDDTLNLRDVRVYDIKEDAGGKEHRVLNKKETTLAQQKQELIKQSFKDWIWNDRERRETLVRKYNEMYNSVRTREFSGDHLNMVGMNLQVKLMPHQKNAVARVIYGGNSLLGHVVGAGKSYAMIAAAMEMRRLGLAQKNMLCVPNHLTEQMASDFLELYPSANILVATKKEFETKNRKKFCAKIATGDYDAVIIGHSQLEKIPMSKEWQEKTINEQIWEIEAGIRELKESNGERLIIKQLEKTKQRLAVRLSKLLEGKRRDDVVTFEQLGVDRLFVDEAHNFKNLFLYTKMRNVAGLSTSEAQKSSDLYMKCRYMDAQSGGKGVIFATGTPVSNSITELYTMQRYLQYDALAAKNLAHFDCWASTFGETVTAIELAPEGTGYRARTRFAKFHNLPELMSMFREIADIQTADMLNLPVPEAKFENIIVEPSELQKEMMKELSERAADVHNRRVDSSVDNMLKISTDGRKIGLDQRLINPLLPDFEGSKVNACADKVFEIWQDTSKDRLAQLVFCDFSTPNKDGRFNVYDDIKAKLIERGIPKDEIAFIHDADTEMKKKELFAKVRQGKVRAVFGSTFKMGAGTNMQDLLCATHDLDCPWRPADLEQRAGRIVRQGNTNDKVKIYRYATNGTFDSYLWQTVQKKQEFIAQIMTSKSPARSCEDVDATALVYAEIKALCAGNPLIAEKMSLDNEVAKLRMFKSEHQNLRYRLEDRLLKHYPAQIAEVKERIAGIETDIAAYTAEKEKHVEITTANGAASVSVKFPGMTVNGVSHSEKEPAAKALLDACKGIKIKDRNSDLPVGEYMGFNMSLRYESYGSQINLLLRGAMTYQIDLGTDAIGNITRIDNALKSLPKRLEGVKEQLADLKRETEAAKSELEKPFAQEAELAEKEARLAVLNAELSLNDAAENLELADDEKTRDDDEPEYGDEEYSDDEPERDDTEDAPGARSPNIVSCGVRGEGEKASIWEKVAAYKAEIAGGRESEKESAFVRQYGATR